LLDTNVLIRCLMEDHRHHSAAARSRVGQLINRAAEVRLPHLVLGEVVHVLSSPVTAGVPRALIRSTLAPILALDAIIVEDKPLVDRALELYSTVNVDFPDAYQAALAESTGAPISSFDRDFDRIPGIRRIEP
jgi:predicted nucleic acid-binding protein